MQCARLRNIEQNTDGLQAMPPQRRAVIIKNWLWNFPNFAFASGPAICDGSVLGKYRKGYHLISIFSCQLFRSLQTGVYQHYRFCGFRCWTSFHNSLNRLSKLSARNGTFRGSQGAPGSCCWRRADGIPLGICSPCPVFGWVLIHVFLPIRTRLGRRSRRGMLLPDIDFVQFVFTQALWRELSPACRRWTSSACCGNRKWPADRNMTIFPSRAPHFDSDWIPGHLRSTCSYWK